MNKFIKKIFVLSLGGSLIAPNDIDIVFLKKFKKLIETFVKRGFRFIITTGGGATCRKYQKALYSISKNNAQDLDWLGLFTNRYHAKFLQLIFKPLANSSIIYNPNVKMPFISPILIGSGGWKPGRSSDDFAVRLAKLYNADSVINLSNIDFVFDKDPRKFKNAKKIESMTWKQFTAIIDTKWIPGLNAPFDPIAAKFAKKNKIKVIIANGKNLKNLKNILTGNKIKGTIIS